MASGEVRRWGLASAVALVATAAFAMPASAATRAPRSWDGLAHHMAAPWVDLQRPNGQLPDYLDGLPGHTGKVPGTRYGDALMGYALLQVGLRERDRPMTRAGLRAITFATSPRRPWTDQSVFETMAVASAYNLARRRLRGSRPFARSRAQWERFLRTRKIQRLHQESHFANHRLVEVIAVLEMRRSGLRSRVRGSMLGSGARAARRYALRLVNDFIPRWAAGRRAFVLSDPNDYPLAYHGLSLGLYARAVELLGPRASGGARRVLRQAVRASALMIAPNGDAAYFGRSQQQPWAPAGTAYGAELTAQLPGTPRADDARAHAVATRSIRRLRRAYPTRPFGTLVTPALAEGLRAGAPGVDRYAGAPSMDGLALALLNWGVAVGGESRSRGRLPADGPLARALSRDEGRFAVVRSGRTWFAVRRTRTRLAHQWGDLRYDAGLVTAQRRVRGRWVEFVPQRPLTRSRRPQSAGPVLMIGRRRMFFGGDEMTVSPDGRVDLSGWYRDAEEDRVRQGAVSYRPVRCGVELALSARSGDRFAFTAFFARRPRLGRRAAADAGQRVSVSGGRVSLRRYPRTLASGSHARLRPVTIFVRAARDARLRVRYCAR